jgi:hypothetical protein
MKGGPHKNPSPLRQESPLDTSRNVASPMRDSRFKIADQESRWRDRPDKTGRQTRDSKCRIPDRSDGMVRIRAGCSPRPNLQQEQALPSRSLRNGKILHIRSGDYPTG